MLNSFFNKIISSLFVISLLISNLASANEYVYEGSNSGGKKDINSIRLSYDSVNSQFGAEYDLNSAVNSFWLVVSDGHNPKNNVNEYAIFYGDMDNNRITAYNYDGQNSANSYKTTTYLQTFNDDLNDGGFSINVANINNAFNNVDWDGAQFDDKIGVWFHSARDAQFTYNANGEITSYDGSDNRSKRSWHDVSYRNTTTTVHVSEPSYAIFSIMFALSLLVVNRKRNIV